MSTGDWIAIALIASALIGALVYIFKRRRNGCAGCPYAGSCGGKCERKDRDEHSG